MVRRDKTRSRLHDERLKDKLAPEVQPHAFGTKRISLENGFYEIFNQPNVTLVDVNETPVLAVTEKGIKTTEKEWEFDLVVCATGFDAITGGLKQMNIRGQTGTLSEHWEKRLSTYLGLSIAGFPNSRSLKERCSPNLPALIVYTVVFFTYGPQAPTALCNGPTCAEIQGDWIVTVIDYMRSKDIASIVASEESEDTWAKGIWDLANRSLLPGTKSWYMGDNIPGKNREPLIYLGGVPTYHRTINQCAADSYKGFKLE
ncbi:hypothetical protein LTR15_012958 [Elasticomyces elasticus]|nr:hypothetical protein LTR15_012958 [Elasticomyces elasticus]